MVRHHFIRAAKARPTDIERKSEAERKHSLPTIRHGNRSGGTISKNPAVGCERPPEEAPSAPASIK